MRTRHLLIAGSALALWTAAVGLQPLLEAGPAFSAPGGEGVRAPGIGAAWAGVLAGNPLDPNGAIGPKSYVEIGNFQIAIFTRNGVRTDSASLSELAGQSSVVNLVDPMVLWDPHTDRFYYNLWNPENRAMFWGFSKGPDPRAIPESWCGYRSTFGYGGALTDFPKLGQTRDFLLIGVNIYTSQQPLHATRADLLWITKPKGTAPVAVCPPASAFGSGKFVDLRNEDGSQGFTPVPAIQTDPSSRGFVVLTSAQTECPDICSVGDLITLQPVGPSPIDPTVPSLGPPRSIGVQPYRAPPDAPQRGSTARLDTSDARIGHAVSGFDPRIAAAAVWVAHAVRGGAGSEVRWYELAWKSGAARPTMAQSGKVSSPTLFMFNAAISPDRTVNRDGAAHGDSMVLGFNTSSASTFVDVRMVSKVGASPQSGVLIVHRSAVPENPDGCGPCRWGDYAGASADPARSLAAHGRVWLTNEWTDGVGRSWDWEASPA